MPPEAAEAVRRVLAVSKEKVRNGRIDLHVAYTNDFMQER
jgi:hypothetical protein